MCKRIKFDYLTPFTKIKIEELSVKPEAKKFQEKKWLVDKEICLYKSEVYEKLGEKN